MQEKRTQGRRNGDFIPRHRVYTMLMPPWRDASHTGSRIRFGGEAKPMLRIRSLGSSRESRPPITRTGPIQLWTIRTRPSVFGIISADSAIPFSVPPYKTFSAFCLPDTGCVPRFKKNQCLLRTFREMAHSLFIQVWSSQAHSCEKDARYPGWFWF